MNDRKLGESEPVFLNLVDRVEDWGNLADDAYLGYRICRGAFGAGRFVNNHRTGCAVVGLVAAMVLGPIVDEAQWPQQLTPWTQGVVNQTSSSTRTVWLDTASYTGTVDSLGLHGGSLPRLG